MASEYALTIAITNTERTKANVKSCGWRASTRKSSASKARAIAADIAKFAKGATRRVGTTCPATMCIARSCPTRTNAAGLLGVLKARAWGQIVQGKHTST